MSDLWVQYKEFSGTTSASGGLTSSVTPLNCLIAFMFSGSGAPTTQTVSDSSNGAYPALTAAAIDLGNGVWLRPFGISQCIGGALTFTGTIDSGFGCDLFIVECGGTGLAVVGASANFQNAPGPGSDLVTSGSIVFSAAGTLIGISTNSSVVSVGAAPGLGTGFTGRDVGANGDIGSWRLESGAFSSNHAATFDAGSGPSSPFVTAGVIVLNAGGGGVVIDSPLQGRREPARRPGRGPMQRGGGRFHILTQFESFQNPLAAFSATINESVAATEASAASSTILAAIAESSAATEASSAVLGNFVDIPVNPGRNRPGRGPFSLGRFYISTRFESTESPPSGIFNATITESVAATESESAGLAATSTITESVAATESESATEASAATITETVAATEASSSTEASAATVTESVAATESSAATGASTAAIAETVAATETESATEASSASLTETVAATDSQTASETAAATITESVAATESSSSSTPGNFAGTVIESTAATEASAGSMSAVATLTETLAATDATSATGAFSAATTESTAATAAQSAAGAFAATIAETLAATESSNGSTAGIYFATIIEAIAATDAAACSMSANSMITESVAATDSTNAVQPGFASIVESLVATEASQGFVQTGKMRPDVLWIVPAENRIFTPRS